MGIIRKMTSVSTLGAVKYRTPNQKTARFTKKMAKSMRYQEGQIRSSNRAALPASQPQQPPPGWYPDARDPRYVRWFDGQAWTGYIQLRSQ
jgi:hypothetical protein